MAGLGKFNFRGKDVLEDINAFQSPNDDLAKLFVDHKGPIIHKWHHYFPIYTQFFDKYRGRPVRFL
jgi:hypothetical protein